MVMEYFLMFLVAVVIATAVVVGRSRNASVAPIGIVAQTAPSVQPKKRLILSEGMTVSFFFAQQWVLGEVKKIKGERARMVVAMDGHTLRARRNVRQLRMV